MPQLVPPPEPPALIKYVKPKTNESNQDASRILTNKQQSGLIRQVPITTREINTPSSVNQESLPSPTPPQKQALPEFSTYPHPPQTNATSLGSPLTVDISNQEKSASILGNKQLNSQQKRSSLTPTTVNSENQNHPETPETLVIEDLHPSVATNPPEGSKSTRLLTQERGGETREFQITPTQVEETPSNSGTSEPATEDNLTPETPSTEIPIEEIDVVEITSDRQEYDEQRQVITAEGNVEMRFAQAVLSADRVEINLNNRIAVAQGNVALVRGQQVLRGERFEYFFVQDRGVIAQASGEVYLPAAEDDFNPSLPADLAVTTIPNRPLSDRLAANQPLRRITTTDGYAFVVGSSRNVGNIPLPESGGRINRLRFQAERVDFDGNGWQAGNIRVTNDPFSPPELELRADTARFRNISPLVDEITTTNSRLALDQNFQVPIFQDRIILDRRPREPGLVSIGFDGEDRGGLFLERDFKVLDNEKVKFTITPQYFLQRAVFDEGFLSLDTLGVKLDLEADLGPRTDLVAAASLTSLDLDDIEDELRASVRYQQLVGDLEKPHTLNLEYSFRDRLFNGSLGFQTVQSNLGAVITSPEYTLGDSGINLRYQGGLAYITAKVNDDEFETHLRTQGAFSLSRGFLLWQGDTLPATREEGLRYTPKPVQPFIRMNTGLSGVASLYSNGDGQQSLSGSIGFEGQFGHFSRPYLDYTGFNISYTQSLINGRSPFRFDRAVDDQTLSLGIVQQIYGPFRLGLQASFSLGRSEDISTDIYVEYSRRTYSVLVRYNPTLEIGSFSFRVNDFNWVGSPEPFEGGTTRPVNRRVRGSR